VGYIIVAVEACTWEVDTVSKKIACFILLCLVLLVGCTVDDEWSETEVVTENEVSTEETTSATLCVYVCGAVKTPGVYELPANSRYADAIKIAGGITKKGNPNSLNLAQKVTDGEKIYIPLQGEAEEETTLVSSSSNGLININTADEETLQTLSGIGKAKAEQIVAYRQSHGNFKTIEEIMQVPGIKEGAFAKIKDSITV
jgi:competence protein ComEA